MKLKIEDYFWAVGKRTKKVKTVRVPLKVGEIKALDNTCTWQIHEVGEDFVKVSVVRPDGETIKTFTVTKDKDEYWRPRSMDGGHEYTLKLVRFF